MHFKPVNVMIYYIRTEFVHLFLVSMSLFVRLRITGRYNQRNMNIVKVEGKAVFSILPAY